MGSGRDGVVGRVPHGEDRGRDRCAYAGKFAENPVAQACWGGERDGGDIDDVLVAVAPVEPAATERLALDDLGDLGAGGVGPRSHMCGRFR